MIHITQDMLPTLRIASGFVSIVRPLPSEAVLTPRMAIEYASKLIEAAARAEGDQLILKKASLRRSAA